MAINKQELKDRLQKIKEKTGRGSDTSIIDDALDPNPKGLAERLIKKGGVRLLRDIQGRN